MNPDSDYFNKIYFDKVGPTLQIKVLTVQYKKGAYFSKLFIVFM